jgi:ferredoxin
MDSSYFVQSKNSFSIDGLKCVRNDYFYNSCEECINICPTSAITLFRNKLTLKDSLCTECSICIGVCPSEAINSSIFSENDFIINTKESKLSCQSSTPCLSIFDEHHFVSLAIVKESDIEVDLSYCGDCNFNDNQSVESSIRDRVNSSNNFLEKIGVTQRVTIKDTKDEKSRRDIFKGLHSFTKKVIDSSKKISSSDFKNEFEKRVPTKKNYSQKCFKNYFR